MKENPGEIEETEKLWAEAQKLYQEVDVEADLANALGGFNSSRDGCGRSFEPLAIECFEPSNLPLWILIALMPLKEYPIKVKPKTRDWR